MVVTLKDGGAVVITNDEKNKSVTFHRLDSNHNTIVKYKTSGIPMDVLIELFGWLGN